MSQTELTRAQVLTLVTQQHVTLVQAAARLGLSHRQTRRLYARYVQDGAAGLVHQNRGRPAANRLDDATRAFIGALVHGTKANQATIDQLITQITEHWDLDRMAVVDRNILRLAVYELLWEHDVPAKVAINEAIEIAKKFGTRESSRFINGILDRVSKELRPAS